MGSHGMQQNYLLNNMGGVTNQNQSSRQQSEPSKRLNKGRDERTHKGLNEQTDVMNKRAPTNIEMQRSCSAQSTKGITKGQRSCVHASAARIQNLTP